MTDDGVHRLALLRDMLLVRRFEECCAEEGPDHAADAEARMQHRHGGPLQRLLDRDAVGEVVGAGQALGLMGGADRTGDLVPDPRNPSGGTGTETLYMELRQGGQPVDPGDWFAETKE